MAGLRPDTPIPSEITLNQKSRRMDIVFDDVRYELSYEFLRVLSPSAEVRGHGPGQEVLQVGKQDVDIVALDPVGNYAIRPTFSDGHDSGLYSWDILHDFCLRRDTLWQEYLDRLAVAGASRDPALCPPPAAKPVAKCGGKA
ncbi:DUF971 domain-containing protein [uncultured Propionivibrio sp.]|uniref:DUF971 domain-containing protein n=1 Tax=uncultured Propionivibrio sp. TaxID=426737 RepID=UPI0029BFAB4C|nr:DUF971 domain-containing protein [uncultured Propionivibrio sp.]